MAKEVCGAALSIGDDYGDNSCTFHCQLPIGHEGMHKEEFGVEQHKCIMQWEGKDE